MTTHSLVVGLFGFADKATAAARALRDMDVPHERVSIVARSHDEEGVIARASGGSPGSELEDSATAARHRRNQRAPAFGGRARDARHRSNRGGRSPCRWIGGSRRSRCGRCGPYARASGARSGRGRAVGVENQTRSAAGRRPRGCRYSHESKARVDEQWS